MSNKVIPNDSKYIPLTQQRWLCVPTCIQMIMLRRNIPLLPAELTGSYMKLVVPKEDSFLFWDKNVKTGEKPKSGYGTQLDMNKGLLNNVLGKLNIPLEMKGKHISKFSNMEELGKYLRELNFKKLDVIVCYDWGTLFDKNIRQGHVCVLDKVDLDKQEIRLIDPEANVPKGRTVKIKKLYQAMKAHSENNSAGFWEFSSTR